jgi:hypothetical protein
MPFEISKRSGKVGFLIGYCRTLRIRDGYIFPIEPYNKAQIFVPGGWVECRGDWQGPMHLPAIEVRVSPVKFETWMIISMLDVIQAVDLCKSHSIDLGRDGFSRIPIF